MTRSLRWISIGIAWLCCGVLFLQEWNHAPGGEFEVSQITTLPKDEKPSYEEEFVNADQDLPFAHVSSVCELNNGTLAALWYGGPYEYCHENTVYIAVKDHGAWTKPRAIMTTTVAERDLGQPLKSLGNPLLLPNRDGSLRLLFVTIALGKWSGGQINTCLSRDGGITWSRVERVTLSPLCNFSELVRNRPVLLKDSGWCIPVYQELVGKFPELLWLKENQGGLLVRKTRIAGGCATLQPSLIPLNSKRAVVLLRDWTAAKKIFTSRSDDAAVSWTQPRPTNLPNPDSGISGIRLSDGGLLVAYNDSDKERSDLSLAVSRDEGVTWKKIAMLENDPDRSFSYPYLIRSSSGMIRMVYSWDGEKIKLVSFNEAWVAQQRKKSSAP